MNNNPILSVIIPCSRPKQVINCIYAFAQQKDSCFIELIVVGDTVQCFEKFPFELILITEKNKHANVRRNIGLRIARGELIAFMDDDAVPDVDWLQTALSFGKYNQGFIYTGPEVPYSKSFYAQLIFKARKSFFLEGMSVHVIFEHKEVSCFDVAFCNCVLPRSVFDVVGFPSEIIPWDMDDFDFCWKAQQKGFIFKSVPSLQIQHDRYPESILRYTSDVFNSRIRTGEKLITHSYVYARIPLLIVTVIGFYSACFLCVFASKVFMLSSGFLFLAYIALLFFELRRVPEYTVKNKLIYISVFILAHMATVIGVNLGVLKSIFSARRG